MGMTETSAIRPRRSALYVPGDRPRAVQKAGTLDCDVIIFDLEDAVAPEAKDAAREAVRAHVAGSRGTRAENVIRINGLDTPWGTEDLLAARAAMPDAILVPKVDDATTMRAVVDALGETDAPETLRLWAMIETPRGILNAASIADLRRAGQAPLDCLVAGTNDLFKETGLDGPEARRHAHGWLMQIVLAARAGGVAVLDGVFNDHGDAEGFAKECAEAAAMGFDGKTLIHPNQITPANTVFSPDAEMLGRAKRLVAAFSQPEYAGRGVIAFEGGMAERMHLEQAKTLLARAAASRRSETDDEGEDNADEGLSTADRV